MIVPSEKPYLTHLTSWNQKTYIQHKSSVFSQRLKSSQVNFVQNDFKLIFPQVDYTENEFFSTTRVTVWKLRKFTLTLFWQKFHEIYAFAKLITRVDLTEIASRYSVSVF